MYVKVPYILNFCWQNESAVHSKDGSRYSCANVYCVTSSTNVIGKKMNDLQKSSTLDFLARGNKKGRFLKKTGVREVCFQNGSLVFKTGELEHMCYKY